MSTASTYPEPRKVCFVTIGATAGFDALIRAALDPAFLAVLRDYGYTDLRLQHGKEGRTILEDFEKNHNTGLRGTHGLKISGFDFDKKGLESEMMAVKGGNQSIEGAVISHAGISWYPVS